MLLSSAAGVWCALLAGGRRETPSEERHPAAMMAPVPANTLRRPVKPEKYATARIWIDALATHQRVEDLLTLTRTLPAGEDRDMAFRNLGYQWLPLDRKATMEWIENVPEAAARELAYGQVVNVWAGMDPHAASVWVAALPDGPVKAATAFRLARSIQSLDPSSALIWAIEGREAPRGDANLTWLATWAGRHDPDACLRILRSSSLPAEEKQTLARLALKDWNSAQARSGHWDKIRSVFPSFSSRP
ncbi:MAG: hypothetical protein V4726_18440 [Verrucomicrobiota bacterium]